MSTKNLTSEEKAKRKIRTFLLLKILFWFVVFSLFVALGILALTFFVKLLGSLFTALSPIFDIFKFGKDVGESAGDAFVVDKSTSPTAENIGVEKSFSGDEAWSTKFVQSITGAFTTFTLGLKSRRKKG